MPYEINASTSDCYKGTTCLINKMNIRNEQDLAKVEKGLTLGNIGILEQKPIEGNFDFEHYKAIHKFIFQELYDWAGKIRTVNLSKKGTHFAPANEIERIANSIFSRLANEKLFLNLPHEIFADKITDLYCDINYLHPFREGNGRVQRVFFNQLIQHAGYHINFDRIDMDELMIATIHASNGVTDYLKKIFQENIK